MAKDGTRRGGRRVRTGDKPKALSDKIAEGKDADIMEFHAPELDAAVSKTAFRASSSFFVVFTSSSKDKI